MVFELYLNKAVKETFSTTIIHFQPQGRNRTSNHEDSHKLHITHFFLLYYIHLTPTCASTHYMLETRGYGHSCPQKP